MGMLKPTHLLTDWISITVYVLVEVGGNGTGKTTLLKILLGELSPVHGVHHAHRSLRMGYFSQHHVDQLDMNVSSVQVLEAKFPGLYFSPFCIFYTAKLCFTTFLQGKEEPLVVKEKVAKPAGELEVSHSM